jgi:hypothetical protein
VAGISCHNPCTSWLVVKSKGKEMNEWQTIAWFAGIGSIFFGAVWGLIKNEVSGVHGRLKNVEHVIDNMIRDCADKKEDFITTKAFDRFESNLTNRFNGLDTNISNLTKRIDDLVFMISTAKEI